MYNLFRLKKIFFVKSFAVLHNQLFDSLLRLFAHKGSSSPSMNEEKANSQGRTSKSNDYCTTSRLAAVPWGVRTSTT